MRAASTGGGTTTAGRAAETAGSQRPHAPAKDREITGEYCTPGTIEAREPIANQYVRSEIGRMYFRSAPGSMLAHEEGLVGQGVYSGGELLVTDMERTGPSITLAEANRTGQHPVLGAEPVAPAGLPKPDFTWGAHSHPWKEGTYLYTDAKGNPVVAGDGVSNYDMLVNIRNNNGPVPRYDYAVGPAGVYRVFHGACDRIAPIGYLHPGELRSR